jgi:hypothetical protein
VAAAAPPGAPAPVHKPLALVQPVDLEQLVRQASYHRVLPLLRKRLLAAGSISEETRSDWIAAARSSAARNLHYAAQLAALAKAFAAFGITALAHKGPVLAQEAYKDLALREFADLDILVRAEDLPRALALLSDQNYLLAKELTWMPPSALVRFSGEISLSSTAGLSVDLHWRLTPHHYPVQLDPEVLWRCVSTTMLAGAQITTLNPEAMLLLLAVHGSKHVWEALGWLADIAWLLVANPKLDWAGALSLAGESYCARPLLLAASLVRRVFHIELPATISARIAADPALPGLAEHVLARYESGTTESPRTPELFRFAAQLSNSRTATLRHLAALAFHPTEIDFQERALPERMF